MQLKQDLTVMQREKLKRLRSELKRREEDGERDLFIRYKFGEPIIENDDDIRMIIFGGLLDLESETRENYYCISEC